MNVVNSSGYPAPHQPLRPLAISPQAEVDCVFAAYHAPRIVTEPPQQLAAWLHISTAEATVLIAAALPRQRRGRRVSKYRFQPDASLAENCRHLI